MTSQHIQNPSGGMYWVYGGNSLGRSSPWGFFSDRTIFPPKLDGLTRFDTGFPHPIEIIAWCIINIPIKATWIYFQTKPNIKFACISQDIPKISHEILWTPHEILLKCHRKSQLLGDVPEEIWPCAARAQSTESRGGRNRSGWRLIPFAAWRCEFSGTEKQQCYTIL